MLNRGGGEAPFPIGSETFESFPGCQCASSSAPSSCGIARNRTTGFPGPTFILGRGPRLEVTQRGVGKQWSFSCIRDGFYRQEPGDLLMPGKPHKRAFPRRNLPSTTGLVWIANGRVSMRSSPLTTTSTASLSRWPAMGTDNCRDVSILETTRCGSFSIAGDSLRGTSIHSHSIVAGGLPEMS